MKLVGLASLVLATFVGMNSASAGFILIDDFDGATLGTRTIGGNSAVAGGTYNTTESPILPGSGLALTASLSYSFGGGLDLFPETPVIRLADMNLTAGAVRITATINGGNSTSVNLSTLGTGNVDFDFSSLDESILNNVTSLAFSFALDPDNALPFNFSIGEVQAVPEPATMALIGLATAGGGVAQWRRRRKAAKA